MKKIFFGILFTITLFGFSLNTFAADSSSCVAPEYLGGEALCPGQDYYNNNCGSRITCHLTATSFNCSTGQCVCQCGSYNPTTGCQSVPASPDCSAQNRVSTGTTCSPSCGECIAGFTELYEACFNFEIIVNFLGSLFVKTGSVFLQNVITPLTQAFLDPNQGPISYFLVANNGQFEYKYGSDGDPGDKVLLEADYADEAGTVTVAGGEVGQVLTINETMDGTEWTNITPSDILPGALGQVLTTVDGGATLVASWEDAVGGGTGADYLGVSNSVFDANIGYTGANAICDATYSGSHVCTSTEILDNINRDVPSHLNLTVPAVWINNGPPAYTANANDCRGWTKTDSSFYGTIWVRQEGDGAGALSTCNLSYKFACCK